VEAAPLKLVSGPGECWRKG